VAGLALVVIVGLWFAGARGAVPDAVTRSGPPAFGLVMVFVLLTYGGWNEAAYLSAEVREPRRTMTRAFVLSLAVVTVLYVVVNWALLKALGLEGVARSDAVAADLMQRALGDGGARLVSALIVVSAATSANAAVFTGARTLTALGADFPVFAGLARWNERARTPVNALLAQGGFALLLVVVAALTRKGFETMVEYTAPVFWVFFLLTGVSLLVLRAREPGVPRPFRVPLYPLTPLVFCATSAYLLYASVTHTGIGALVGVTVLALGVIVFALTARAVRTTM
jgi:amino acid transporter